MPYYDYVCEKCHHEFNKFELIDNRDNPVKEACPSCKKIGAIARGVTAVQLSYSGFKSMYSRAGDGWKEVQQKIKKGSGKGNTIRTK